MKAVLVGIDSYPHPYELKGCVNDVLYMRKILTSRFNFQIKDIRTLVNERASKSNILQRLEWLLETSDPIKLFYYSGHGSQIPNRNYEEDKEADYLDEILCPVDFSWSNEQYIVDDEIQSLIDTNLNPNHKLILIFDCCHSGTVYRALDPTLTNPTYRKARFIPTPVDLQSRTSDFDIHPNSDRGLFDFFLFFFGLKPKATPVRDNVVSISACRDDQTASEVEFMGRCQGALSYFLQGSLAYNPNLTVGKLVKQVDRLLKRQGFAQDVQLHCSKQNRDKTLFDWKTL